MKKILSFFIIAVILIGYISSDKTHAAAKKAKKSAVSATQIKEMTETVDKLTTKIYAGSLFSPEDNAKLINIKIQLDNQMLMTPDATLAPIYYKAGNLYKAREYRNEAIDCFQTILENFGDTALAPKAYKELTSLGIKVNPPQAKPVSNE